MEKLLIMNNFLLLSQCFQKQWRPKASVCEKGIIRGWPERIFKSHLLISHGSENMQQLNNWKYMYNNDTDIEIFWQSRNCNIASIRKNWWFCYHFNLFSKRLSNEETSKAVYSRNPMNNKQTVKAWAGLHVYSLSQSLTLPNKQ